VFILDAWENVCHHHIVNILSMVGDSAVFLDSINYGDEFQDAAGKARLVKEQFVKYGGMNTFNKLASDSAAACIEMRRLVTAANPGLSSLKDHAHVSNLLIGDLLQVGVEAGALLQVSFSVFICVPSLAAPGSLQGVQGRLQPVCTGGFSGREADCGRVPDPLRHPFSIQSRAALGVRPQPERPGQLGRAQRRHPGVSPFQS